MSAASVTLRIDGRSLQAAPGSYVLAAARQAGIEIPTLCDHPALEPVGACRLCVVEVTHPDWNGWSRLVTSCLYPVAEGIVVSTRNEQVLEARRRILALLAARCPDARTIQTLAKAHGVEPSHLRVSTDADDCILCGLCTRVCESYATSAISTLARGTSKLVGTFGHAPPSECVGCGACAIVCPTDAIEARRTAEGFAIWRRTFPDPICTVQESLCIGCGSCEEACPFAVARVVVRADARKLATIAAQHCRGCGACVGACPSGAIDQPGVELAALLDRCEAAAPGGAR